MSDHYSKLRNFGEVPDEERCSCEDGTPMMLVQRLSRNPLACFVCNGEVEPSSVSLPLDVVDSVAHWCWIAGAFEALELDSGPYEEFALSQMLDLKSPLNVEGLAVRSELDPLRRCYYVLTQRLQDETMDWQIPTECPSCGGDWTKDIRGISPKLLCEKCSLVVMNTQ
jgi:hypothetical protein